MKKPLCYLTFLYSFISPFLQTCHLGLGGTVSGFVIDACKCGLNDIDDGDI